jgi:hypothetical protein
MCRSTGVSTGQTGTVSCEMDIHYVNRSEKTRMSKLPGMFPRYSVTRLYCKELSHLANFGVVPTSGNAVEVSRLRIFFLDSTPDFFHLLFLLFTLER